MTTCATRDSALSWEVVQHHNGDHTHPHFAGTGNDTIDGMGGDDAVLRGDDGGDKLTGGGGTGNLYAGNGIDALISRDGVNSNDSLDGGSGTETRTTDASEKSIVGFP